MLEGEKGALCLLRPVLEGERGALCLLRPVLEGERGALHVSAETMQCWKGRREHCVC